MTEVTPQPLITLLRRQVPTSPQCWVDAATVLADCASQPLAAATLLDCGVLPAASEALSLPLPSSKSAASSPTGNNAGNLASSDGLTSLTLFIGKGHVARMLANLATANSQAALLMCHFGIASLLLKAAEVVGDTIQP